MNVMSDISPPWQRVPSSELIKVLSFSYIFFIVIFLPHLFFISIKKDKQKGEKKRLKNNFFILVIVFLLPLFFFALLWNPLESDFLVLDKMIMTLEDRLLLLMRGHRFKDTLFQTWHLLLWFSLNEDRRNSPIDNILTIIPVLSPQ